MNSERQLVNSSGMTLMSDGGPVAIQIGENLQITEDGRLIGTETGEFGRLQISQSAQIERAGGNLYLAKGQLNTVDIPIVQQGALEQSNVDPLSTMVELIQATRYFEAFQKAMQTSDEADSRLIRLGG